MKNEFEIRNLTCSTNSESMPSEVEVLKLEIRAGTAGFTLIEILVVATLIGILSTVGFSGFQAITRSGRDALRKSDLESIRSALEIYKSENEQYPTATSCSADLTTDYINPYPVDPKPTSYQYCYIPGGGNLTYELCAHLENDTTTGDAYCNASGNCGAGSTSQDCNYKAANP